MILAKDLKRSGVAFDEERHTYTLDGRELSGVTSLIHAVLQLGVYPEASDYVRRVQIPRAGYYGTCVHKAIQQWNDYGIAVTEYPEVEHPTAGTLPAQDVSAELAYYRGIKPEGCRTVACEFTVSYGDFATQIDDIWDNDGIYLVDHKTNNLDYYPGGADGLKDYLSWQLSCYAFMFEHQTGYKVKGLLGNWLRKGAGELWRIGRKPDADVECLLSTEIERNPDDSPGSPRFLYRNDRMQVVPAIPDLPAPSGGSLAVPSEVTEAIADLLRAEKAAKAMKERLRELMEQAGVTKWECDDFTATIGKESVSKSLDSAAFKAAHPEMYKEFTKDVKKKGIFTIKAK